MANIATSIEQAYDLFNIPPQIIEIWKPIIGYESIYEISSLGRIKSLGNNKEKKEKIMQGRISQYGYREVNLRKKGDKMRTFTVHRLVAKHFHANPENKPCVNHINCIKDDNRAVNLEYCTYQENMDHACENDLVHHMFSQQEKDEIISKYIPRIYGQEKLAIEYKCDRTTIQRVLGSMYGKNKKRRQ